MSAGPLTVALSQTCTDRAHGGNTHTRASEKAGGYLSVCVVLSLPLPPTLPHTQPSASCKDWQCSPGRETLGILTGISMPRHAVHPHYIDTYRHSVDACPQLHCSMSPSHQGGERHQPASQGLGCRLPVLRVHRVVRGSARKRGAGLPQVHSICPRRHEATEVSPPSQRSACLRGRGRARVAWPSSQRARAAALAARADTGTGKAFSTAAQAAPGSCLVSQ